ncbi:MAG: retroviral-like aspartic protease family protein [Rhizomicrobium sp.]
MTSRERVSRRRLVGAGAAALACMPGVAHALTGTRIAPPAPPELPESVEHIQGGVDRQNRMTVETFINGKGPYRFIVDTGADTSVLCEDVAAALGLPATEDVIVQGIARALPAPAVRIDELRVGRVSSGGLAMPLLPRGLLGADGFLGLDMIDQQAVTFDFQNHRLTVAPSTHSEHAVYFFDEALVRVNGSRGRLTAVNTAVDGVRASAFIDSGAEISIGNSHLFDELARNGSRYVGSDVIHVLGVTGGTVQGRIVAVERIKLGPISFRNSVLVISDLPVFDMWGLGNRPALFIGMNFLRQTSAVTIDYGRKEFRFKLAQVRVASRG